MTALDPKTIEECARVADAYADANLEMAGDSVLTDPILSGGPPTPANIEASEKGIIDGCVHSSMYHAAKNIAAAIRALPSSPPGWRAPRDGRPLPEAPK